MKCGIEIHQRIAGSKLFCNCVPSPEGQGKGTGAAAGQGGKDAGGGQHMRGKAEFTRRLHAVLSELGELDSAVRLESIRQRAMRYSAPADSTCLVEADEEPPHRMNNEALAAVLLFCRMLCSGTVDELHVMRKNVIDGSNTSGFQRTAVAGMGGSIATPVGKLGIQTVCIEEESAGITEGGKEATADFELSRLGIPLVEIATEPTLASGKEAQEAALAIGTLLRRTGLVQRGIGSIRQDLNVSIPEGARVEIKGVQELSMISATVELEVQRQERLLKISSELSSRLAGKQVEATFVDLTGIFSETASQLVGKATRGGARVFGMRLPSFAGLLGQEIGPGRRFGSELADYARSAGLRGLIHSDEDMSKYGFSEDELAEVRAALSSGKQDAFALVVGDEKKARAALCEVTCRANFLGVPEETRKANPDGTSSYMRPLPGKARMYPETDIPPIPITKEMLSEAAQLAGRIEKGEAAQEKMLSSLNGELSAQLSSAKNLISHNAAHPLAAQSPELSVFASAIKEGADPKFAASVLTSTLQSLKREGVATSLLDEPKLLALFLAHKEGLFAKSATADILRCMCSGKAATPEEAVAALGLSKISGQSLARLIAGEKLDFKGLMSKYRLRVDAAEAQELLKKEKK